MSTGLTRGLLLVVAVLLAALLLQPYVDRLLFSAPAPRPIQPRGELSELERSSARVFEAIAPSVVQVVVMQRGGVQSGGAPQPGIPGQPDAPEGGRAGAGTGFVWDELGHVVTNHHVVDNAASVVVRFAGGNSVQAQVVGRAPNYDLAVLRIGRIAQHPPPVPLGSAANLQVGQVAYAIGNPFGLSQSLTMGIISALKRRLPTSGGREIADAIQTDAAINPGNSGGPLLDSAGRLIGVNTAIYSPSGANAGVGFAIPVDVVNRIVPALIRDGRVPTPGIGIFAADETVAAGLAVPGIIIAAVVPGSSAERAGLTGIDRMSGTLGDVITEVDGRAVKQLTDLAEALERAGVGKQVTLTVRRGGEESRKVTVAVTDIGER
jgi:2-alkenal reductase